MKEIKKNIIDSSSMKKINDINTNNEDNEESKKFNKIIVSYNFKKNNYFIPNSELEGYKHKEFLLNTLHNYNNQTLFKFDSPYNPSCKERMIFLIPIIIIILIIIYILYILTIICTFNPLIIYLSYLFLKIVFGLVKNIKNRLYEKYKKKAISKIIDDTNDSEYCKINNLLFVLGISGYWLELKEGRDNYDANKILLDIK